MTKYYIATNDMKQARLMSDDHEIET